MHARVNALNAGPHFGDRSNATIRIKKGGCRVVSLGKWKKYNTIVTHCLPACCTVGPTSAYVLQTFPRTDRPDTHAAATGLVPTAPGHVAHVIVPRAQSQKAPHDTVSPLRTQDNPT